METTEASEIHLRTDEVNELLATEPQWIYRWGIFIIFVTLVLVLVMSRYITYADTLVAKITITTVNPPVTLVSKTAGKIVFLDAKNNQAVKKNEVLMVIGNTADYKDVMTLSA